MGQTSRSWRGVRRTRRTSLHAPGPIVAPRRAVGFTGLRVFGFDALTGRPVDVSSQGVPASPTGGSEIRGESAWPAARAAVTAPRASGAHRDQTQSQEARDGWPGFGHFSIAGSDVGGLRRCLIGVGHGYGLPSENGPRVESSEVRCRGIRAAEREGQKSPDSAKDEEWSHGSSRYGVHSDGKVEGPTPAKSPAPVATSEPGDATPTHLVKPNKAHPRGRRIERPSIGRRAKFWLASASQHHLRRDCVLNYPEMS